MAWSAFGSGAAGDLFAVTETKNGDLVVGGQFQGIGGVAANNIARWNGATWAPLGSGLNFDVASLLALPQGDLLAGGWFTAAGGSPANRLARWNGAAWSPLGAGTDGPVSQIASLPDGDILVGGDFFRANGAVACGMARLEPTCPAGATPFGSGCSGAGGPDVLVAIDLPWIGATSRSRAAGLPTPSIAIGVLGFTATSLPLAAILPTGLPGCSLLVAPDLLLVELPSAGAALLAVDVPSSPVLAGLTFHQQAVTFELDPAGAILAVTSSNALTLTIGVL